MKREEKKISLDDLIDVYIEKYIPETKKEKTDVRYLIKEKLAMDISEEIIKKEKEEIMSQIEAQVEKENEIKKRRHIKILVIETLFLGFLIGLLANQGTDIITFVKGGNINIGQTLIWIVILLLVNMCFAFLVYIDKLNDVLNKE